MRLTLRILFLSAFLGSLYWIHRDPSEPEPYISTVLAVASVLGTFYDAQKKAPNMVPRLVTRPTTRGGKSWDLYYLVIHNNGDDEVRDFTIKIILRPEQRNPLLEDEKEEGILRYPVIHPDQKFESPMSIGMDTGVEFDVVWSWSVRGKKEERKGAVKAEFADA